MIGTGPPAPGIRGALVRPVATCLLVVVTFVGTYLLVLLAPIPHDLRVAVVESGGPIAALHSGRLRAGVELVGVPDEGAAEAAVRGRRADGAVLPRQRVVLTAGTAGPATAQAVRAVADELLGDGAAVRDVAPLPPADPRGLAGFYLVFGMVLAAFIFGQTSHLYGRALPLRLRLAQTAVVAPAAGVLGALIAVPVVGATAAPLATVAVVLTLLVAAVALTTQAATGTVGDPGILASTLLLLTLGNAAGGGAIPAPFLPDALRRVGELLPPGAAVRALQDAAAFPDVDPTRPYLVLLAWSAAALLVLFAAGRRAHRTDPVDAAT